MGGDTSVKHPVLSQTQLADLLRIIGFGLDDV